MEAFVVSAKTCNDADGGGIAVAEDVVTPATPSGCAVVVEAPKAWSAISIF